MPTKSTNISTTTTTTDAKPGRTRTGHEMSVSEMRRDGEGVVGLVAGTGDVVLGRAEDGHESLEKVMSFPGRVKKNHETANGGTTLSVDEIPRVERCTERLPPSNVSTTVTPKKRLRQAEGYKVAEPAYASSSDFVPDDDEDDKPQDATRQRKRSKTYAARPTLQPEKVNTKPKVVESVISGGHFLGVPSIPMGSWAPLPAMLPPYHYTRWTASSPGTPNAYNGLVQQYHVPTFNLPQPIRRTPSTPVWLGPNFLQQQGGQLANERLYRNGYPVAALPNPRFNADVMQETVAIRVSLMSHDDQEKFWDRIVARAAVLRRHNRMSGQPQTGNVGMSNDFQRGSQHTQPILRPAGAQAAPAQAPPNKSDKMHPSSTSRQKKVSAPAAPAIASMNRPQPLSIEILETLHAVEDVTRKFASSANFEYPESAMRSTIILPPPTGTLPFPPFGYGPISTDPSPATRFDETSKAPPGRRDSRRGVSIRDVLGIAGGNRPIDEI